MPGRPGASLDHERLIEKPATGSSKPGRLVGGADESVRIRRSLPCGVLIDGVPRLAACTDLMSAM